MVVTIGETLCCTFVVARVLMSKIMRPLQGSQIGKPGGGRAFYGEANGMIVQSFVHCGGGEMSVTAKWGLYLH